MSPLPGPVPVEAIMTLAPGGDLAQGGFAWTCSCGAGTNQDPFLPRLEAQAAVELHAQDEHEGRVSLSVTYQGRLTMDPRDGYIYETAKGRDVEYVPGYFGPMW